MRSFSVKVLLLVATCSIACGVKQQDTTVVENLDSGEKVLFVISFTDFRDEELSEPREMLKRAGFKTIVASTDTGIAKGMLGSEVKPDILISAANADDYQALIIAGGPGCRNLWDDSDLAELTRKFTQQDKVLGAICLAPVVLANAGLLEGVDATCFSSARDNLASGAASYKPADVVVSGRIVTASGPDAAHRFAQTILNLLENQEDSG